MKTSLKELINEKNFLPIIVVAMCIWITLSAWSTTVERRNDTSASEGLERVEVLLGEIGDNNAELVSINYRLAEANEKLVLENSRVTGIAESLRGDLEEHQARLRDSGDTSLENELLIDNIKQIIARIESYNLDYGISGEAVGETDKD